jgi:tetratricopeptide (TPR) repeat protein
MTDSSNNLQNEFDDTQKRMIEDLQKIAVDAALNQSWTSAIEANLKILKEDKKNIASLNRLGFAYMNAGNKDEAVKTFQKVKKLDPYNLIAIKNLTKLGMMKSGSYPSTPCGSAVSPMMFLEDPGKTRIVQCVNVAPAQTLSHYSCGQEIFLRPKNHCIELRDSAQTYLGALPDDLSFRLIKYLKANNQYCVHIKSADNKNLTVFIRELSRGKKFSNQPSFASTQLFQSYHRELPPDGQSEEKPDVSATGEEPEEE